jgi:hypothetical protein
MVGLVVLKVVMPMGFVKLEEESKKEIKVVGVSVPGYSRKLNQTLIVEI